MRESKKSRKSIFFSKSRKSETFFFSFFRFPTYMPKHLFSIDTKSLQLRVPKPNFFEVFSPPKKSAGAKKDMESVPKLAQQNFLPQKIGKNVRMSLHQQNATYRGGGRCFVYSRGWEILQKYGTYYRVLV
jgi:hypothetical protein